jgi:hypothetical protein
MIYNTYEAQRGVRICGNLVAAIELEVVDLR